MAKKIIIGVLALAVIAGVAFSCLGRESDIRGFRTVEVTRGDLVRTVKATGAVQPEVLVQVGSQVTGQVKEINVDFNSRVTKGQVLAVIDDSTFRAQVKQDQASLNRAWAQVNEARAKLKLQEKLLVRDKILAEKDLITQEELETSETNLASLKAERNLAAASAMQAKAALETSEARLGYCIITSPVDGVVIARNVDVGQSVAASLQIQTMFTIATDLSKMQVLASVSEADIGSVREGQKVRFRVDAYPETEFEGEVTQVRLNAETVSNVVTYPVIVSAGNPDGKLKPGMTATIYIETQTSRQVLTVPNAALRFAPDDTGKGGGGEEMAEGPGVWIETDKGLRRVPVKRGLSDGTHTEIEGEGVTEGMQVVTGRESASSGSRQVSNPFMPKFPSRKARVR